MLIIERHQQDEWCWWFSCYVHYLKTWRILEGSIRDFLDFVSEEKPEKKKYNRTYTFLFIQSVNEYNLKLIVFKKLYTPKEWAEVLNTISYEKALTRGPTLYLFIYHFWHKGNPFVISFFNILRLWNAAQPSTTI